MVIELIGHVNEKGELSFVAPHNLPTGDVRITIESFDEAADEALWDEQFASAPELLTRLADEAHAQFLAGQTEPFDPDTDEILNDL